MLLGNGFRKTLSLTLYGEAAAVSTVTGLPQASSTQQVRMDGLAAPGTGAPWMEEDGQTGARHTWGKVAAAGSRGADFPLADLRDNIWHMHKENMMADHSKGIYLHE